MAPSQDVLRKRVPDAPARAAGDSDGAPAGEEASAAGIQARLRGRRMTAGSLRQQPGWRTALVLGAVCMCGLLLWVAPSVSAGRVLSGTMDSVASRGLKEAATPADSMYQSSGPLQPTAVLPAYTPAPAPAPKPAPPPVAVAVPVAAGANAIAIPATAIAPAVAPVPTTVGSGGINIVTSTPVSVSNPITIKNPVATHTSGLTKTLGGPTAVLPTGSGISALIQKKEALLNPIGALLGGLTGGNGGGGPTILGGR